MRTPRTLIRLATLLAAVSLVAAGCGSRTDDDQVATQGRDGSSTTSSTTTTVAGDASGGSSDAGPGGTSAGPGNGGDGGGSGGTSGDGSGSTSGGGSGGGGTSASASDPQPIAPGLYRYDTEGRTRGPNGTEPMPGVTTLEARQPDGSRQRTIRDLRDDDGEGSVNTVDLLYRDDGVYLRYLKIVNASNFGTFTFEFEFEPPQRVLPANPGVGFHNEFSAESNDGSIQADIVVDITGEETLSIGGRSVDTLTTETVVDFSGSFEGRSTWNDNVDPEHFLIVREDRTSNVEFGLSEFRNEYVATLRSLRPS